MSQTGYEPASGWVYVGGGAFFIALGLIVLVVGGDDLPQWLPFPFFGAGGLGFAIGATAIGVTVGVRRADWIRGRS